MQCWRIHNHLTKILLTVAILSAALNAETSLAGDWQLDGKVSEKVELVDNYNLKADLEGFVFGSLTNLNLDAIYKGHDFRFDLIGDLSYRHFLGPGSDDISNAVATKIETKFNKTGKTSSFDFTAGLSRTEASSFDDLERVLVPVETYRNALNVSASFKQSFGPRSTAGLTASLQKVMFEDSGVSLSPSVYSSLGLFWNERLTKRTTLSANTVASWLAIDDASNTSRETLLGRLSLTSQVSPRLKVTLVAGAQMTFSHFDDVIFPFDNPIDTARPGWVGEARLDYTYKHGSISAFASRATEVAALGDLQGRSTFGLLASRKINELSEFTFSVQYRIAETGIEGNQHVLSISPVYSRKLTDEWGMQTGYKFTYVNDAAFDAKSNTIFVSISKAFVLSP
jgi:hypothetical protein